MSAFLGVGETAALLRDDGVTLIDCRFRLTEPDWGSKAYAAGHLPGAHYAHLDEDLAAIGAGPGRHPLPHIDRLRRALARWGVRPGRQVVAYDDAGGAIAARLWWLLRYCGHERAAILDGGWQAWQEAGLEVSSTAPPPARGGARFGTGRMPVLELTELERRLAAGRVLLLDARARPRFAGEAEPIDRKAGHIPGAVNRPFDSNLERGRLKERGRLAREWGALLGPRAPDEVVHRCGSGVTACFNLACMEHLGLRGSALFVASWSGWIEDPRRPIATG